MKCKVWILTWFQLFQLWQEEVEYTLQLLISIQQISRVYIIHTLCTLSSGRVYGASGAYSRSISDRQHAASALTALLLWLSTLESTRSLAYEDNESLSTVSWSRLWSSLAKIYVSVVVLRFVLTQETHSDAYFKTSFQLVYGNGARTASWNDWQIELERLRGINVHRHYGLREKDARFNEKRGSARRSSGDIDGHAPLGFTSCQSKTFRHSTHHTVVYPANNVAIS